MTLAVQFHDMHTTPASTSLRDEILMGFRADQKFASPKFGYSDLVVDFTLHYNEAS